MQIVIDYYSNAPIYEQVVEQIKLQIFKGDIPPCSIMPSIRAFAVELKVSVITIKKIYEILLKKN